MSGKTKKRGKCRASFAYKQLKNNGFYKNTAIALFFIQNTIEKNAGSWYNETNNFMTSEVYLWQQVIKNFGNF